MRMRVSGCCEALSMACGCASWEALKSDEFQKSSLLISGNVAAGKIPLEARWSIIGEFAHLSPEHPVGENRVAEDERQHDQRPREDEGQRFRRARRLPDRHPVGDDIGVEAVAQPDEAEQE